MIELQLGLALHSSHHSIKGFELNGPVHHPSEAEGPSHSRHGAHKKRGFEQAFEFMATESSRVTLPLLRWDHKQPNEDDDHNPNKHNDNDSPLTIRDNKNKGGGLVGWPPVKTWRKRTFRANRSNRTAENGCRACGRKSMYVKVKMEGAAIARKIDLSAFESYENLTNTLIRMFDYENSMSYRLIYKDREGDWLVARDMPWSNFIRSAQLLKLQRING